MPESRFERYIGEQGEITRARRNFNAFHPLLRALPGMTNWRAGIEQRQRRLDDRMALARDLGDQGHCSSSIHFQLGIITTPPHTTESHPVWTSIPNLAELE